MLRRARSRGVALVSQARGRGERDEVLGDIRAVYRGLLRWADQRGHSRRSETTPLELAAELAAAIPESRVRVAATTERYVAARYGQRGLEPPELEQVREHLQGLTHAPDGSSGKPRRD